MAFPFIEMNSSMNVLFQHSLITFCAELLIILCFPHLKWAINMNINIEAAYKYDYETLFY